VTRVAAVVAAVATVVAVLACVALGAGLLGGLGAGAGVDTSKPARDDRAPPPRRPGARVTVRWSEAVRGWPSQLAADDSGVIAVSGGRFVSSFASGDGSFRWETEVSGPLHPFMEPAVDARSVLVSAGDRFVMLDRADGAIRWEAEAGTDALGDPGDGGEGVALVAPPASGAAGGAVALTAGPHGSLSGRDATTGTLRWSIAAAGTVDGRLEGDAGTGTVVAVWRDATGSTVRALDVGSGAIRWEQTVEAMAGSPAVAGDTVIVAAGDGDYSASVRALGLADGTVRWQAPVPASFEPGLVPGIAGVGRPAGVVGVVDHHGTVSLLELRTGALRWRTETGVPALGGRLLLTSDAVVIRNEGQQLVVLDRSRGGVVDRRTDPEGLPEGIAAVGDRVLVGWRWTQPGRIDALEIEIVPSRP